MAKTLVITVAEFQDGSREVLYCGDDVNAGIAQTEQFDAELHAKIEVFRNPQPFKRIKAPLSEVVHHTPLQGGVLDPDAEPEVDETPIATGPTAVLHSTPLGPDGKLRKVKPTPALHGGNPQVLKPLPEPKPNATGKPGPWHPSHDPAVKAQNEAAKAKAEAELAKEKIDTQEDEAEAKELAAREAQAAADAAKKVRDAEMQKQADMDEAERDAEKKRTKANLEAADQHQRTADAEEKKLRGLGENQT